MKRSALLTAFVLVAALAGCSHAKKDAATPPATAAATTDATSPTPAGTSTGGAGTGHTAAPAPTGTSTIGPDGTASECTGGTIVFGTIVKPYVLTRVSLPFTVTAGKTTKEPPMSSVGLVSADVKAGPQVPSLDVYRAFTAKVGIDPDVVLLGEVFDGTPTPPKLSSLTAGKYVAYNGIRAAQSTFTYKCGGQEYDGFVSSYLGTDATAVKCGKTVPAGTKPDGVAAFKHCK
jgi:hypothetical protein